MLKKLTRKYDKSRSSKIIRYFGKTRENDIPFKIIVGDCTKFSVISIFKISNNTVLFSQSHRLENFPS